MTVLIVDDDEDVREMLTLCLSNEGYDMATAADGVEALERLRESLSISLVLLDLRMPRMNGFELLAAVRRTPRLSSIPFVALTGDSSAAPAAVAAGAVECLVKPLDYDEIVAVVHRFARRSGRAAA